MARSKVIDIIKNYMEMYIYMYFNQIKNMLTVISLQQIFSLCNMLPYVLK